MAALITEWREAGGGGVQASRPRRDGAERVGRRSGRRRARGLRRRDQLIRLGAAGNRGRPLHASRAWSRCSRPATWTTPVRRCSLVSWPTSRRSPCRGSRSSRDRSFAVGEGTAVSPAATQVGVVPGILVLGAVPDSTTSWPLLLLALAPSPSAHWQAGSARSCLVHGRSRRAGHRRPDRCAAGDHPAAIAVLSASAAALLAFAASGSIGPRRLSATFRPRTGTCRARRGLRGCSSVPRSCCCSRDAAGSPASARHERPAHGTGGEAADVDARLSGLIGAARPDAEERHPSPFAATDEPAPAVDRRTRADRAAAAALRGVYHLGPIETQVLRARPKPLESEPV